jgi:hypothetical protein
MKIKLNLTSGKSLETESQEKSIQKFIERIGVSSVNQMFILNGIWYNRSCIESIEEISEDENQPPKAIPADGKEDSKENKAADVPAESRKIAEPTAPKPSKRGRKKLQKNPQAENLFI